MTKLIAGTEDKVTVNVHLHCEPVQLSKADEICILEELYAAFAEKGMYLTSLLSADLLKWATAKIHEDASPDVYGYLSTAIKQLREAESKAEQINAKLKEAGEALRFSRVEHATDLARYKAMLSGRDNEMGGLIAQIADLKGECDDKEALLDALRSLAKDRMWADGMIAPSEIRSIIGAD